MFRMILRFFVAFSLCINIVTCGDLTVFRDISSYSHHDHKLQRQLLCISDNPTDAIVWNTELNGDSQHISHRSKLSSGPVNVDKECEISMDSDRCFPKWRQHYGTWDKTNSFEVPMGPIYDSRWEDFPDNTSVILQRIKSFGYTDAVVFSIRGSGDVQILVYDEVRASGFFSSDTDYWIKINGSNNNISSIEECQSRNGEPTDIPSYGCDTVRNSVDQHYLSVYEWRTFVLVRDRGILKLFNPNQLILSYKLYYKNNYGIYFKSLDKKMQFRFHKYNYILTHQPGAILRSPPLSTENIEKICIDILVGLCKQCELVVNLVDGLRKRTFVKKINPTEFYNNIDHNLPMWQYEKIDLNVNGHQKPIRFELIAVSSKNLNETGNHWAIAKVEKCLPKGTVKRLRMITEQKCPGNCSWPIAKCQRLSYNSSPNSEVVDATLPVSIPQSDLQYCPKSQIGPYCETNCTTYFKHENCSSIMICNRNICFCTQGYSGNYCDQTCSPGFYGYGCAKKCSNCTDDYCDSHSGICKSGCKQWIDGYLVPPYCNTVIESANYKHAYWATPLVLLLVLIGGCSYYHFYIKMRGRNREYYGQKKIYTKAKQLAIEGPCN